ncbi:MAG: P63C domain-containing protein, partial [Myxococcota bacterium]
FLALFGLVWKYVTKGVSAWQKRFPDEYYEEIYRILGWQHDGSHQHAPRIGRLTADWVYARLPEGVLEELRRVNPSRKGRRQHKHHQFLSPNTGHRDLDRHLYSLLAIMRSSATVEEVEGILDRMYPKLRTIHRPKKPDPRQLTIRLVIDGDNKVSVGIGSEGEDDK